MAPYIEMLTENSLATILVQLLFFTNNVQGYYCEWNLCEDDQYCCGDNQCCNDVYSTRYFWAGIVFFIIMLLSFGGFFRYCYAHRPQIVVHQITNFVPVSADRACPEEMEGLVAYNEDLETLQSHPADAIHSKSPPFREAMRST